ncbi:phage tail protein [Pseudomonas lundensis]|uniref:tail protein X n=1 Tax=Pseudomonas TaxID=286 RepID=UPI00147547D4|nr:MULTISPECIES: tail protein X [Pseudomonas]MBS5840568.1 tail protein X [Pseudomonas sp.]NNA14940.1 phage tail protein [Pseudomonas lundensis]
MATILNAGQHDTVDALCWRHYGRTAGVTEAVLEANPGLADYGPFLPCGTLVTLPEAQPAAPQRNMVNLWD